MLSCSIDAMLDLWIDFFLARQGEHGYGGHVAEIYAYRLEPYNPRLHHRDLFAGTVDNLDKRVHYSCVAGSLVALLNEFCRKWDCSAKIDGLEMNHWHESRGVLGEFDWRCHVEILPINDCENPQCHDHGRNTQKAVQEDNTK